MKMTLIDKKELLQVIENKYGDLTNDRGCYVYTGNGDRWLSIESIVEIINECCTYDG